MSPEHETPPSEQLGGGTCHSMGGVQCDCPDGSSACTNVQETECNCKGGAIAWPDEGPAVKPEKEETGGNCASMGKQDCVCPNGGKSCTNAQHDACMCGGESIPWPSVPN